MEEIEKLLEEMQKIFAANLKRILEEENINQKQLAERMDVLPSTVSKYSRQLPTTEFVIRLKAAFPNISIDEMFREPSETRKVVETKETIYELDEKTRWYTGAYFVYYLDTNAKHIKDKKKNAEELLRIGLIYILNECREQSEMKPLAVAVLGMREEVDIERIKQETENITSATELVEYLKPIMGNYVYTGTMELAQPHLFVQLRQVGENKDSCYLVMHHVKKHNTHRYYGGLAAMNSVSHGRDSEPVVQIAALSNQLVELPRDEIVRRILMFTASVDVKEEANEILTICEKVFARKYSSDPEEKNSQENRILSQYLPQIVESNLERLVKKNMEMCDFGIGRISMEDEYSWYKDVRRANDRKNSAKS